MEGGGRYGEWKRGERKKGRGEVGIGRRKGKTEERREAEGNFATQGHAILFYLVLYQAGNDASFIIENLSILNILGRKTWR